MLFMIYIQISLTAAKSQRSIKSRETAIQNTLCSCMYSCMHEYVYTWRCKVHMKQHRDMKKYRDKLRQTASRTPGRGRPRYKIYDFHVYTDVHIGTQMYIEIRTHTKTNRGNSQRFARSKETDMGYFKNFEFHILNSKFYNSQVRSWNLDSRF